MSRATGHVQMDHHLADGGCGLSIGGRFHAERRIEDSIVRFMRLKY